MSLSTDSPVFVPPVRDTEAGRAIAEHGYYIAKGVYNPEEVAELDREFDRILGQLQASGENINATWGGPEMARLEAQQLVVMHTHNVQQYSAVWLRAMLHERFLGVARDIIGDDIVLNHSKLFAKPPERGAPFPMHQDWDYFPTVKDSMIAGIIHVSRATDEMGCLRVYPGSQKLGRITDSNGQQDNEVLARYPIEGATPLEAEPGDVVFFHYCTIHGSMPNRSQEMRKTVLIQLYAGDDRVEDGVGHPDERLVLSGWNHHATRNTVNAH